MGCIPRLGSGTGGKHEYPSARGQRESFRARHSFAQDRSLPLSESQNKITCLTAYDYPTARLLDEAGVDIMLVGDSVGMAVLGYDSTLPVTLDEMLHHVRAVRRGTHRALLVVDMPYGSFHVSIEDSVRNAMRLVKEGGAEAVKVEGGERRIELIHRLVEAEIPVMGHVGLTPQSMNAMGGFHVQGKSIDAARQVERDARAVEAAGAFAVVLESMPRELAAQITAQLRIPTIGIGAGPDCDGQVLVFHDLVGLTDGPHAEIRAPLRESLGGNLARRHRILRRRSRRPLPVGRGVLPFDRRAARAQGEGRERAAREFRRRFRSGRLSGGPVLLAQFWVTNINLKGRESMDTNDFRLLYDFNAWANRHTLDACAALDAEQFLRDLGSSFGSVRDTLAHIYGAEWIWLERWLGRVPTAGLPSAADFPDFDSVRKRLTGNRRHARRLRRGPQAGGFGARRRIQDDDLRSDRRAARAFPAASREPRHLSSRPDRHDAAPARRESDRHRSARLLPRARRRGRRAHDKLFAPNLTPTRPAWKSFAQLRG